MFEPWRFGKRNFTLSSAHFCCHRHHHTHVSAAVSFGNRNDNSGTNLCHHSKIHNYHVAALIVCHNQYPEPDRVSPRYPQLGHPYLPQEEAAMPANPAQWLLEKCRPCFFDAVWLQVRRDASSSCPAVVDKSQFSLTSICMHIAGESSRNLSGQNIRGLILPPLHIPPEFVLHRFPFCHNDATNKKGK